MFRTFPGIILAAFLAACAPAFGATPSPPILNAVGRVTDGSNHGTDQASAQSAIPAVIKNSLGPRSSSETVDVLWYEILTGLFGITALGQLILLLFQTLVTGKAANAAKLSAHLTERLVAEFETPFLFPVLVSNTIGENLQQLESSASSFEPLSSRVIFTVKNFGRTPALLQKTTAVLYFGDVDEGRNDPLSGRAAELMLEPQGSLVKPFEREIAQPIDKDSFEALKEARTRIFLRGRITFLDVLGNRFEQTFCFTWDRENGAFIPWGPHRNRRRRLISKRRKLG